MLKNRYFKIILKNNEESELLIRVKKDFYTEGVFVNNDKLLQGYFDFYNYIYLNILDNNDLESTIAAHKGIVGNFTNGLSYVGLDEEFIEYQPSKKITADLTEINDEELINKMDLLIRNSVRNLTQKNKSIYNYFHNKRMLHYKELKESATNPIYCQNGDEYIIIDDDNIDFTRADLIEIKKYLETLNPPKKLIKGRDETGKKIRKKRK